MICKHCSTENPESAVFCGICGKRLDGNVVCSHCGNLMPEENNYCFACGARMNTPPAQASAQPESAPTSAQPASVNVRPAVPAKQKTGAWKKILEIIGGAVGMTGVFFALLFTFLIGISAGTGAGADMLNVNADLNLYYYFGKVYEQIATGLSDMTSYSAFYEANIYLLAILGTVLSAATIITVFTLSVITLVRYLRKLLKKSEKDYAPTLIGAILTYILGASLFLGFNNMSITAVISSSLSVSAGIRYNTATLAGIILSVLFLCGFIGCRAAQFGKKLGKPSYLYRVIFSGVGTVLIGIVWSMATNVIFALSDPSSVTIRLSAYNAINMMATEYASITSEPDMALYVSVLLTLVLQIALTILSALIAIRLMKNLTCEKSSACLGLGIAQATVALVMLIAALLACSFYLQAENIPSYEKAISPVAIVAFVFSILLLGTTIAHKILKNKFDKAPNHAQPLQQPVPVQETVSEEPASDDSVTNEPFESK